MASPKMPKSGDDGGPLAKFSLIPTEGVLNEIPSNNNEPGQSEDSYGPRQIALNGSQVVEVNEAQYVVVDIEENDGFFAELCHLDNDPNNKLNEGVDEAQGELADIEDNDHDFADIFQFDSDMESDPNYEPNEDESDDDGQVQEEELHSGGETTSDDEWITSRKNLKENKQAAFEVANDELADDGSSSEEFMYSHSENSDDEVRTRPTRFKAIREVDIHTNFKALVWKVGMKFSDPSVFKKMVIRYAIVAGYSIRWFRSNNNVRMGAKCKVGCLWKIYASWDEPKEAFVVKSVYDIHTCNRQDYENIQLKPSWLAREYLMKYKGCPNWPTKSLIEEVMEKYGVTLSKFQCYRTKREAHKLLHGSLHDHYMRLGSYLHELRRVDKNTTAILLTVAAEIPRGPDVFKRLYMSFNGLREGFKNGCRPILCFDGCFLKTFLGGMLLCAVGRDGNNQMYPVAWAVVEAENNDSWSWFLDILKRDIPWYGGAECTVISDQQKGLINVVTEHFPLAEHRNCARHIFSNWHKQHKGEQMRMLFWKAARAYTRSNYDIALEEMRLLSSKAVDDFLRQNPVSFCRSQLRTLSKADVQVNNLAETFNGYILEARAKPVISMMEEIRIKIMERLYIKRKLMEDKADDICPRIRKRLEKEKEEARKCMIVPSDHGCFQVMHQSDMVSVNLHGRSCSCRKWDLSGIPCCHVVACCNWLRVPSEDYVFDWFKKDKYLLAYGSGIRPINGPKHWEKIGFPLDPPPIKIGAGRPRKNRKKDPHERFDKPRKLTRHGLVMTCQICKSKNHNKRTCPQKNAMSTNNTPGLAKKKGRPRKEILDGTSSQAFRTPRQRGRPRKGTNSILSTNEVIPRGMGAYFPGNNDRVYINPGLPGAAILSQASSAPGPSPS